MLSKKESKVMSAIFSMAMDKTALLVTPTDLRSAVNLPELTLDGLEKIVTDLMRDGYFSLVYSDRHGEPVYCISLTERGKGFLREGKLIKRNIVFRLCVTVALAIVSFIIGLILKAVF